ncbi:TMEM175 family protein [Pseudonocardia sp.]|uniref:TMEM175 family protein n=1 Tax=Pseudonocardia sp. TaxID=60912 RepID=UPI003D0B49F4
MRTPVEQGGAMSGDDPATTAEREDDEPGEGAVEPAGVGRLLAFSDGVFSIAFTILVLDIAVPDDLTPAGLRAAVAGQVPQLLSAVLSFAVIGRFWISHHDMLRRVRGADGGLLVVNIALLAAVALIPFTTSLLAEYGDLVEPTVYYAGMVAISAALQLLMLWWLTRRGLFLPGTPHSHIQEAVGGLGGTVVAFVVSIPVAFLSTTAAQLCWLLAFVPVTSLLRRLRPAR